MKPRSRLVSFRVTQEELEHLRAACLMQGARNVSEFARSAVLDLSQLSPRAASNMGVQLLERSTVLELQLAELRNALQQNHEMLRVALKSVVSREPEPERSLVKGT
ncbi:MAG: hypothetical protein ABI995_07400 [Acidobacteriota bacterium]